jgi:protein TonB
MSNETAFFPGDRLKRKDRLHLRTRVVGGALALLVQGLLFSMFLIKGGAWNPVASGADAAGSNSEITVSLLNNASRSTPEKSLPPLSPSIATKKLAAIVIPADAPTQSITLADAGGTAANANSSDQTIGDSGPEASQFQKRLQAHIAAYRQYPAQARHDRLEGVVQLIFTMDRSGIVLGIWVKRSSGFVVLDRAAVATVLQAQPLPPIPENLPDPLNITLPVSFGMAP